jgi:3',5'-cyclic AMP phosphodiesterase CpdA
LRHNRARRAADDLEARTEMRIVCVADLHGFLPPVPACDLLVVAGDVCPLDDESPPAQRRWLRSTFARWLDDAPAAAIVGTPGNHDFVAVEEPEAMRELPWCCLIDERSAGR